MRFEKDGFPCDREMPGRRRMRRTFQVSCSGNAGSHFVIRSGPGDGGRESGADQEMESMPELREMESENMTNHRHKPGLMRTWLPVAGALLIAGVLFFSGALEKQRVWENMTDPDDREQVYLDQGMELEAEDGKNYGVISRGPYLDLPAGSYRMSWYIWGDGENRIHLVTSNGARIDREVISIPAGGGKGEATFTLLDEADQFEIQIEFVQGSRIKVEDIRLYSPKYKDPAFLLLLVTIALSVAWIAFCRGVRLSNRTGWMLIAFALLFSCAPFLKDDLIVLHDIKFHIPRICNLADGLRSGQFPVRAGGYTYNGYGAITSAFYPDFFLVPFALMLLWGASCQFVFSLLLMALNYLIELPHRYLNRDTYEENTDNPVSFHDDDNDNHFDDYEDLSNNP